MADCIYPYTRIPNTVIDVCNQQAASDGKTPGAYGMAIYLILARHTDSTGRCFPSLATMAKDTGLSRRLVAMIVKRLEDVGLIIRERRITKEGDPDSTMYSLPHLQGGSAPHALPSAPDAPRVVNDMHYGSAPHALGVVHHVHPNKNQLEQEPINQPAGGLFPDLPNEPKPGKPKPSKAKSVASYKAEYFRVMDGFPRPPAEIAAAMSNYAKRRIADEFTEEDARGYVERYIAAYNPEYPIRAYNFWGEKAKYTSYPAGQAAPVFDDNLREALPEFIPEDNP